MADILKEILKELPSDKVSDAGFEGANIVLYTKDIGFFLDNHGKIKEIVDKFKKRVELRPDPSITLDKVKAEVKIKKILPKDAGVTEVIFDEKRSRVIIHAEKPGIAIGKQGSLLRTIRKEVLWVPLIKRSPPIRSSLVENTRAVLYENSEYRRKFLNKVGHRIYDGWIRGKKSEWVRISFLGGARQVGRTCLLLQTPESRVLIDCGIDVAAQADEDAYPHLDVAEFNINELDAVIVSHAHVDHSGLIPYLFKYGYTGPVYCTAPTRDIMALLQLDIVKIQRSEGKDPIYTSEEIKNMVLHTICLGWEEVTDITPDIRLTFYNSGHILGSSLVHLNIGNGLHNVMFTGDLKYLKTNLLEAAISMFPRLETMIIESTYGAKDKVLPMHVESDDYFLENIKKTIDRGGKILMPVLGSGRAQEVMIIVEKLINENKLKPIPVYVDGMLWDITAIHTAYPEFLNKTIRKRIFHKDNNPFLSSIFKRIGSHKERIQLIEEGEPCIILATSGMLSGGPSVEYFKALASNPKNTLMFSCYQAPGSLGRRIQNGEKEFIFKENGKNRVIESKMDVLKLEITGHSDRRQLMNYIARNNPRPKRVIIIHGEVGSCIDFASSIHKQFKIETIAPRNLDTLRIR